MALGVPVTAVAVMMLVEEHKIALDERIDKYFPEAKAAAWNAVTVRQLLTHTSGIPNIFGETGDDWRHSNTGYELLGFLIHRVTGKFYGDFLKEQAFAPLHMDSTSIISEQDIVANRVSGYRIVGGKFGNQEWIAPSLNTLADGGSLKFRQDLPLRIWLGTGRGQFTPAAISREAIKDLP